MAMPAGTKKWTTLATWADADILNYFETVQGQTATHARASLAKLRRIFKQDGTRNPGNPFAKGDPVSVVSTVANEPAPVIAAPVSAPVTTIAAPKPVATDAAGHALAAMVLPHILDTIAPMIADAVAGLQSTVTGPRQLVVMRDKVEHVLTGSHHYAAPKLLKLVSQGLNVMLVGPAGCGKTTLANTVAKALGHERATIISLSAGTSEAQLLGRLLPLGDQGQFRYVESPFMRAYANGGIILLDEIDAADANLLLVINAALANGEIEIEARAASGLETRVKRHPDCVIIAAANTYGRGADLQFVGRGALDAATLDRFYMVTIDYDADLEATMGPEHVVTWVNNVRAKARAGRVKQTTSSRMITRIAAAINGGLDFADACADQLASWSTDERAKVQ